MKKPKNNEPQPKFVRSYKIKSVYSQCLFTKQILKILSASETIVVIVSNDNIATNNNIWKSEYQ